MEKSATLSECGTYRYRLGRRWNGGPTLAFVMLNPSTADASEDDPTIRKCIGFAKRLGYSAIEVVNLYAYRATDPAALKRAGFPAGNPDNDRHIFEVCSAAHGVICAWGAHARGKARPGVVRELLGKVGAPVMALAFTDDGEPRHPLMLAYDKGGLLPYPCPHQGGGNG